MSLSADESTPKILVVRGVGVYLIVD